MQVDLRSDTLTTPTPGMRTAMANADVGDDVYAEDPTVNALEREVAQRFGRDAALFVPTGTMGNQLAVRLLVAPGQELVCHSHSHVVTYEHGAAAAISGITTRTWNAPRGGVDVAAIEQMLRPPGFHMVATAAVAVENTHNWGGGSIPPPDTLRRLRELTTARGVRVHCDGARLWNAHVATGVALSEYAALFDTLSVCLSKGLGAPVGSLLVGDADTVAEAREVRARLGGAWRQAGVLAAAGRYALTHHVERLADDHRRAARLAELVGVDPSSAPTNIVTVEDVDSAAVARAAAAEGVRVSVTAPNRIRLLTHLDVDDDGVEYAGTILRRLLAR